MVESPLPPAATAPLLDFLCSFLLLASAIILMHRTALLIGEMLRRSGWARRLGYCIPGNRGLVRIVPRVSQAPSVRTLRRGHL